MGVASAPDAPLLLVRDEMGASTPTYGGNLNPNHPVYARIIDLVQRAEIDSYRALAGTLGIGLSSAMDCVSKLEDRGRLTRTQNGVFVALGQEPKSGVFMKPLPVLSAEQRAQMTRESLIKTHQENRARNPPKTPYRPRRKTAVLEAVIEQSEVVLQDAPPDDPELGRLIVESKKPTAAELRAAKRAAEAAAGRARLEAMERARAEREAAKRRAKEAAKAERAKAAEERRAARAVIKAIEQQERQERRIARGMKSGRSKYCRVCEGLGERRPKDGPCPGVGCGKSYEREVIEISASGFSSLAMFDGF